MALVSPEGEYQQGEAPRTAAPTPPNPYKTNFVNPNSATAKGESLLAASAGSAGMANADPGQGKGEEFTRGRQAQAYRTQLAGLGQAEEGDYSNREALRQALSQQIGQYGGAADQREQNFLGTQERGLANNVAQMRRQMGGSGGYGSQQGGRNLGSMLAASQQATGQGLNQLQLQKGQELNALAGTQGNLLNQGLAERGQTYQQAQSLADLLQRQAAGEQDSILATRSQPGPSDFEKYLGYGLQTMSALNSGASGASSGAGGMAAMF